MIPKPDAPLFSILNEIDLIIFFINLNPISSPESVDGMLSFGRGEEDDGLLIDGGFEAVTRRNDTVISLMPIQKGEEVQSRSLRIDSR